MSNIMVVDDSLFMRTMITSMLRELGHTVCCEASTGNEAIDNYKLFRPDVVTMDITMPDMNGLTALKEIISFDPQAKIILCSALYSQSIILLGLRDGAIDFVEKPISMKQLETAIWNAAPASRIENSPSLK